MSNFLLMFFQGIWLRGGKPAPDLFLHAAKSLGIVPHECIVVGDSIHDMVAARAAGMIPTGFIAGSHLDDSLTNNLVRAGATNIVKNSKQLAAYLSL